MKVNWAPLNVPLNRRLETLAAFTQIMVLLFGEFLCILTMIFLIVKGDFIVQSLSIGYLIFIWFDRKTADNGGRGAGSQWVRSWIIWKYFVNYFPVDLVKTADLPADRNYLFALFPHGVLSTGGFANFNTNYTKFRHLFPGIRSKLLTLSMHFNVPIFRELVFGWGMASASANSIKSLLTASNDAKHPANRDGYTSNAAMVVIGGAQEALHSRPNNYEVILNKRKGFVKIALYTGATLVPVISFGEVDLFDQPANPPGSLLRSFQEAVKRMTGVSPIFFNGRGMFQYNYGLIPQRRKVTTVVGAPIPVSKTPNPSNEDIEMVHKKFSEELYSLFESHKAKYIENSDKIHMVFV